MSDLRKRLAEVLAKLAGATGYNDWSFGVDDAIELIRDPALARALEDAERYVWLRDLPEGSPHEHIGNLPGDMWDTAIDAARNRHD